MNTMSSYYAAIHPENTFNHQNDTVYQDRHQVRLKDGSWLDIPLRALPGDKEAIALLMSNQSAFAVTEHLMRILSEQIKTLNPDSIVAVPTMGLEYASCVAKQLGMKEYVAMGFSRKFWYDENIKQSVVSTTSPDQKKDLYLDPDLVGRVKGKRVVVVDDVINTGQSVLAAVKLLQSVEAQVIAVAVALTEGYQWHSAMRSVGLDPEKNIICAGHIPVFMQHKNGWIAKPET